MIPSTTERVPRQTADSVNEEIRRQTEENVSCYASVGPSAMDRRLKELDTLASIFDKEGVDVFNPDPDPCPGVPLGALTQHDGVPVTRHRCHVGALGISPG